MPRRLGRVVDPPIKLPDMRLTCANKAMRPVLPDSAWHYPELLSPQLRVSWRPSAFAPPSTFLCAISSLILSSYLYTCVAHSLLFPAIATVFHIDLIESIRTMAKVFDYAEGPLQVQSGRQFLVADP